MNNFPSLPSLLHNIPHRVFALFLLLGLAYRAFGGMFAGRAGRFIVPAQPSAQPLAR